MGGCGSAGLTAQIWFEALVVALPQAQYEFNLTGAHVRFATFSLYFGLLIGSTFWGLCSDIIGRRPSWNITLFLSAVFGIAVGAAPTFPAMCVLLACQGLGLGGNLPVDGAVLIECTCCPPKPSADPAVVPGSKQWILTLLSLFWCIGQLFAALIGWAFITNYSCDSSDNCPRSSNMGWRYTWFLLGGVVLLMWFIRFFIYPIPESPKYLLATKREQEALDTLHFIAKENGKTTSLTLEKLRQVGLGRTIDTTAPPGADEEVAAQDALDKEDKFEKNTATAKVRELVATGSPRRVTSHWFASLSPRRIRETYRAMHRSPLSALFASYKMSLNTILICACWGAIGLSYPLYNSFISLYLKQVSSDTEVSQSEQYRQLVIIAACGIPGSLFATAMVELPYMGRRGSMAIFTGLTGVFLFLFTTARTSSSVLGWNCAASLAQNAMYGILYAITYEVFPAPQRGTGDGLSMSVQRVFGVVSTVVAITTASEDSSKRQLSTPIYVSASFFLLSMVLMLFLPYEPRGRNAL